MKNKFQGHGEKGCDHAAEHDHGQRVQRPSIPFTHAEALESHDVAADQYYKGYIHVACPIRYLESRLNRWQGNIITVFCAKALQPALLSIDVDTRQTRNFHTAVQLLSSKRENHQCTIGMNLWKVCRLCLHDRQFMSLAALLTGTRCTPEKWNIVAANRGPAPKNTLDIEIMRVNCAARWPVGTESAKSASTEESQAPDMPQKTEANKKSTNL
jgi:hypothetical protein